MSKYKLLVKYPTLPKDWEIGMEVCQGDGRGIYGDFSPCNSKYTDYRLEYIQVTEEPIFWEKIPEVSTEFEVLKWRLKSTPNTISTYKRGENENLWEIFTVCRLSDGICFSIGDTVKNPKLRNNDWFTIKGFTMDCLNEHLLAIGGNGGIGIRKIEHYNAPLFKTHDGVEIFIDDTYVVLFPSNGQICGEYVAHKGMKENCWNVPYLNFSTKEKAQEYAELNSQKYSMQDILDAFDEIFCVDLRIKSAFLDKLKK